MGIVGGSATRWLSDVAVNDRACGGMVVGVQEWNPGWTELWSEQAAFPRRGMRSNSPGRVRAKSPNGDSSHGMGGGGSSAVVLEMAKIRLFCMALIPRHDRRNVYVLLLFFLSSVICDL